ncbi:MAG: SHOCT domain-containing protein [Armatimonadetes bacterium]|nr:SHOCT domain-containing protein [Armatimonadota bacterium]NIM23238.1 SHOCT domain-containing protein [Armatimonadota bacterium]NIM67106.1 SHOCT domain-containing protein [Armatimonadota bacterium]NIM75633.1 SHOCT domain-containing protein [Armatimonadota bacterium]NIN05295.1 SHOCT domain-containing protein [Armatimonadota bacterium]
MMLSMLVFWVLVIAAIIHFVRWAAGSSELSEPTKTAESAPDILQKRYANGEISREQYQQMRQDLKEVK